MIREVIVTILFPAVLFFWAAPFVSRLALFRKFNLLEKTVLIGVSSASTFVILASWGAVLGNGLVKALLGSLFLFALASFFYWLFILFREKPHIGLSKFSTIERLLLIIILVILLKSFIISALRPIVDPDVIVSHIPFARTIVEENAVPAQDKYTLNPMTIPPIGGTILYAITFVLSGSTFSESFRLFTFPFFIGLAILAYLIGSKIAGRLFGLVSVIVFLSLPWVDTLLLEWAIYPELLFAFFGLSLFYFLEFHFFDLPQNEKRIMGVFFGLILASSLLLKDQGLFLFFLLPLLILLRIKDRFFKALAVFLATLPLILLSVNFSGLTHFGFPRSSIASVFLLGVPIVYLVTRRVISEGKSELREVVSPSVISATLGITGTLWILRNITLYTHPVLPLGGAFAGFYDAVSKLGVASPAISFELKEIQLLFLPVFGTLMLLPKILGLFSALLERKLFSLGLWFFVWYAVVVLYFGQANERYLAIVMPALAVLIAYGILGLQRWLENLNRKKLTDFLPVSGILFGIVSLSQSALLSWNLGQSLFPSVALRRLLFEAPRPVSIPEKAAEIREFIVSLARVLNTRPGVYTEHDVFQLLVIGLFASLLILVAGWIISSINLRRHIVLLGIISVILFTIPYFYVIWSVSEGEVLAFAQKERDKVYNLWGLETHVVPYLKENAEPDSVILVFGPQTGLSFKTGLRVWNVEIGYGLKGLAPVIFEKDEDKIVRFFRERNIDYILVFTQESSLKIFDVFGKLTKVLSAIGLTGDSFLVVSPSEDNFWALYEVRQ